MQPQLRLWLRFFSLSFIFPLFFFLRFLLFFFHFPSFPSPLPPLFFSVFVAAVVCLFIYLLNLHLSSSGALSPVRTCAIRCAAAYGRSDCSLIIMQPGKGRKKGKREERKKNTRGGGKATEKKVGVRGQKEKETGGGKKKKKPSCKRNSAQTLVEEQCVTQEG